ncbi:hypothetical protein ACJJTC_001004 [Scirpophaga incertulas]
MKPLHEYRNGNGGSRGGDDDDGASLSGGASGSGSEDGSVEGTEWSLRDPDAPGRALCALNALRKSRQYYDVVLVAGGAEVAAHRAVLAAASPYLLRELQSPEAVVRVRVGADELRALVDYAYTGRLRVRDELDASRLYRAAWRLRLETARTHLAARLLARPTPGGCLRLRALPGLGAERLAYLDTYIADHFSDVCASGAMAALPALSVDMLLDSSAAYGEETPAALADAALSWLRDKHRDTSLEELCSRTHLLYVDSRGELRDCGELPASTDEAPEVGEYRREAAERERGARRREGAPLSGDSVPDDEEDGEGEVLGERVCRDTAEEWRVVAVGAAGGGVAGGARALLSLGGRLAAARLAWRAGGGMARGAALGGGGDQRLASMAVPRCAHGAGVLDGRLVVCGGYERTRVLRAVEAYNPNTNMWEQLPDMRGARARFAAAALDGALYCVGGSDGHAELAAVDALAGGMWSSRAALPDARAHAAVAAHRYVYAVGGWSAGRSLRRVDRYDPVLNAWEPAPPLITARSQCAAVVFGGVLWALGGCDAWRCIASTEYLPLEGADTWLAGPALPTARRSVGGCEWRARIVSAGGSDGSTSLQRVDFLANTTAGPALRKPRAAPALAALDDALYAAGGFDGKQFLACVECLYDPDGEWTLLRATRPPSTALSVDTLDENNDEAKSNDGAGGTNDNTISDVNEHAVPYVGDTVV